MRMRLPGVLLLLLVALGVPSSSALDAQCSACEAVAAELQRRLDAEVPRTHLDMRHRLDKDGNRYGKILNYKVSEMRAVDLLEGLCSAMDDYTLISQQITPQPPSADGGSSSSSSGEQQADADASVGASASAAAAADGVVELAWVKYRGEGSGDVQAAQRPSKHEEEQRQKQLKTFCGLLIERHEDEVIDALTSDKFEQGVMRVLCQQISSKCKGKQYAAAASAAAAESEEKVEL